MSQIPIGYAFDAASALRAFVYTGGAMYNLNTLVSPTDPLYGAITLIDAEGINDSGQILANGTLDGNNRAFLLTPVASVEAPERASLALLAVGVVGAFGARRRKSA